MGLYKAEDQEGLVVSEMLASHVTSEYGVNQEVELDTPVTLEPGTHYVIAQGRVQGSGDHWRVEDYSVADLIAANTFFGEWIPGEDDSAITLFVCDEAPEELLGVNVDSDELTSTVPAVGFFASASKADPLFAQDARFNSMVSSCRRDFTAEIRALVAPSLSEYQSCMFYDVTRENISRVNADALAAYKASVTAGKPMTEAQIIVSVQNLALRYSVIDRLINKPETVYINDLINIGLTGLNDVASKYQAINTLRALEKERRTPLMS